MPALCQLFVKIAGTDAVLAGHAATVRGGLMVLPQGNVNSRCDFPASGKHFPYPFTHFGK